MNLTDHMWDLSSRLRSGEHPDKIKAEVFSLPTKHVYRALMLTLAGLHPLASKSKAEALVNHMSPLARSCGECGEEFSPRLTGQARYCSKVCRRESQLKRDRVRRRAKRNTPPVDDLDPLLVKQIRALVGMGIDPESIVFALKIEACEQAIVFARWLMGRKDAA